MKFFIIIIVIIASMSFTKAQAPNFTQTDIYGNTYNLYDQLNLGKVVLIDFYSVGWPTCMTNAAPLDTIYQDYQPQLFMYGIESYDGDSAAIEQFKLDYGPISYPMFSTIDNDSILGLYNVYGTPRYYVVCPDSSYRSVNLNDITDMIDTCLGHMVNIETIEKSNINIYSNKNKIFVNGNFKDLNNTTLNIYDLTGKRIDTKQITSNNNLFYVSYTQGIYIVKLYSRNELIKTQKIVIQ